MSVTAAAGGITVNAAGIGSSVAIGTNVALVAASGITLSDTAGTTMTTAGLAVNATNQINLTAGQFVSVEPFLRFTEHSASTPSLSAGQALFWVKDNTPNTPRFTDDTNADFDIPLGVSSTSIAWDATSRTFQRAALTGAVTAGANINANVFGTGVSGNALSGDGTATLDYIGSTTNVNSATTAGALGVVDISALKCGGVLSLQSLTESTIDGFTAKSDGFWFVLHIRDATTGSYATIGENVGNTTTSVRTPAARDYRLTKNDSVLLMYSNQRWRIVQAVPKMWMVSADSVTWAATTSDYTRTGRGVNVIRVTLTGNQTLTGVLPDPSGFPGGEILLIENIDTTDTLTIAHDATSTAANRFLCPAGVNYSQGPLTSTQWRYDATSSRWRMMGHS